jgi:hypothetical protein
MAADNIVELKDLTGSGLPSHRKHTGFDSVSTLLGHSPSPWQRVLSRLFRLLFVHLLSSEIHKEGYRDVTGIGFSGHSRQKVDGLKIIGKQNSA